MLLAKSDMISRIDKYAEECIGISTTELMRRAGRAVANAVREKLPEGKTVVILAGKGNNGGDGYAAAVSLLDDYDVTVYDIFSEGQKNEAGKHFLNEYNLKTENNCKFLEILLTVWKNMVLFTHGYPIIYILVK